MPVLVFVLQLTCGEGSVALSLCTTAHPLRARITKMLRASVFETTVRPNPSCGRATPVVMFLVSLGFFGLDEVAAILPLSSISASSYH